MSRRRDAEPPVQDDSYDDVRRGERALTAEEQELCQNIVVFGVEYLRTVKGWTATAVQAFLQRVPIRRYIETLQKQYSDRTGIQERTQFFAQLKINAMVPAAVNILARSLRGAYIDAATGKQVPAPTKGQFDAAIEVLNRANVQGVKWNGNDSVPAIDARSVQVAIHGSGAAGADPFAGFSGESRERIRAVLGAVAERVKQLADADGKRTASSLKRRLRIESAESTEREDADRDDDGRASEVDR